jgi:ABC-type multidrug transport system fused ATPase/permease subunit
MKPNLIRGFIISTFVSLYLIVSIISTIHVIDFFRLSNPNWLAVSLAIAFEIGAAASLASLIALDKMNKTLIWFLFILLTAMQMMGNTYYAFTNLENYQSWVELFGLVDEEPIFQKRMLSLISGAILPLVALGFIKSLVDYIRPSEETLAEDSKEETQKTADRVWAKVNELRKEGKLPEITEEDTANEPTALANSQYREETYKAFHGQHLPDIDEEFETASLTDLQQFLSEEESVVEAPIVEGTEETVVEAPVIEEIVVETPIIEETVAEAPVANEPVVEEINNIEDNQLDDSSEEKKKL